jgi:DNA-binding CsgD family transcriptional regulator
MASKPDPLAKRFGPLLDKTLSNALAHCIGRQFPHVGGPRIRQLCAEMLLKVVFDHLRPREHVRHGQVLWMAVSTDDPPRRHQRIAETHLVPVVLDLCTAGDIEALLARTAPGQRLLQKLLRLCRQAYEQGGLLSNCDLSAMLHVHDSMIASVLTAHERTTGKVVPRRATVHDVGSGMTHKRIICLKRYRDGKRPEQVAQETYHSLEAVDRYLGQYDRVRHCRLEGLSPEQTAYTLNCSAGLVRQYLEIDDELEAADACQDSRS